MNGDKHPDGLGSNSKVEIAIYENLEYKFKKKYNSSEK
jgi:hypothetical protein